MAVSLTLTGSGTVGKIQPGWSVQSDATPVVIGDASGGTGNVSLTVAQGTDSEFVINNDSVFTHDTLGHIDGQVINLNSVGAEERTDTNLSLNMSTTLTQLNANRVAPPILDWEVFDSPDPFISYGTNDGQVLGSYAVATNPINGDVYVTSQGYVEVNLLEVPNYSVLRFTADGATVSRWGIFPGSGSGSFGPPGAASPTGGPSGIAVSPINGDVYVYDGGNRLVQRFNSSGVFQNQWGSAGTGNGQFGASANNNITIDSAGNVYVTDRGNSRYQKFSSTGTFIAQATYPPTNASVNPYAIAYNPIDGNIYVSLLQTGIYEGDKPSPGTVRVINTSLGLVRTFPSQPGSLNGTGMWGYHSIAFDEEGYMWASVAFANYLMKIDTQTGLEVDRWYLPTTSLPSNQYVNDSYGLSYNTFNKTMYIYVKGTPVWWGNTSHTTTEPRMYTFPPPPEVTPVQLSSVIQQYVDLINPALVVDYQATNDPFVEPLGWSDSVWTKLKELCAVYSIEIAVVNGQVRVRDIGTAVIDVQGKYQRDGRTNLNIDARAAAKSIDINYYNTYSGTGVIYDATADNKIFSIDVGQNTTETVTTKNHPVYINPVVQATSIPLYPGQYYLIGSDNLPVNAQQWIDYGGSINVSINPDVVGAIDVTLIGPREAIPGVPAPYSLAISDGSTTRPAFSVTGGGVFSDKKTLNLLTGVSADNTTVEVGQTIDNIFVNTLDQAYDRGVWASSTTSGPMLTLNATFATSVLQEFGLAEGSLVRFKEGIYRISSITIGNVWSNVIAQWHVNMEDMTEIWYPFVMDDISNVWDTYIMEDMKIKPLRN